ncbi:hypothetical protein C7M84_013670 [Penaeus vannamei]|uniref:Uncharacterized protein n=1 Tax=Penaeus vannamei TaxID=6689 RepID=A0A3R7LYT5_PENVA|nr:hypothetical protein C7M84_013670 [Penaeus vannamei]
MGRKSLRVASDGGDHVLETRAASVLSSRPRGAVPHRCSRDRCSSRPACCSSRPALPRCCSSRPALPRCCSSRSLPRAVPRDPRCLGAVPHCSRPRVLFLETRCCSSAAVPRDPRCLGAVPRDPRCSDSSRPAASVLFLEPALPSSRPALPLSRPRCLCCSSRPALPRCCSSRPARLGAVSSRPRCLVLFLETRAASCCSSRPALPRCCSSRPALPRCCSSRPALPRAVPRDPRCLGAVLETPAASVLFLETRAALVLFLETPRCLVLFSRPALPRAVLETRAASVLFLETRAASVLFLETRVPRASSRPALPCAVPRDRAASVLSSRLARLVLFSRLPRAVPRDPRSCCSSRPRCLGAVPRAASVLFLETRAAAVPRAARCCSSRPDLCLVLFLETRAASVLFLETALPRCCSSRPALPCASRLALPRCFLESQVPSREVVAPLALFTLDIFGFIDRVRMRRRGLPSPSSGHELRQWNLSPPERSVTTAVGQPCQVHNLLPI